MGYSTLMDCGCKIYRDQITEEYELEYCIAHKDNWQLVSSLEAQVAMWKNRYRELNDDYWGLVKERREHDH